MKVLMTGASGFIGGKVAHALLEAGHEVVALSSREIPGVRTIDACGYSFGPDYLVTNGGEGAEVLLHLGAFIPKAGSEANDIGRTTGNITSTRALLASGMSSLRGIVYASSIDVYGNYAGVIDEDAPTVPTTLYGWSKLYCEKMVQQFAVESNITSVILRIGHVYGEGEEVYRKVMPVMIRDALAGKPITIYGDGNAVRCFIYIDDVVSSILAAVNLEGSCVVNVASDEQITINQLAEKVNKVAGTAVGVRHIEATAPNRDCIFDNSRLREKLHPSFVPFDEGLAREIDYMRGKAR